METSNKVLQKNGMYVASDQRMLTCEEVLAIIEQAFYEDSRADTKGAGSFCKYVQFEGNHYALLTQSAEKLTFNALSRIMDVINKYELPVPIVGLGSNTKEKNDYAMIMPKIEGLHLPSRFFTVPKNLTLMSAVHENISQEANDHFVKETTELNGERVFIDFHGANFMIEKKNRQTSDA